jgi:hypothetical protein
MSPGQIVLPGLCKLTSAADFSGRLDLYNGEFVERGGGMSATTYVDDELDVMVLEVKGANPNVPQTAELRLWLPRKPEVGVEGLTCFGVRRPFASGSRPSGRCAPT